MTKRTILTITSLVILGGCSATSLRCGTDGDDSYLEVYDIPQKFANQSRGYAELCGFAYDQGKNDET